MQRYSLWAFFIFHSLLRFSLEFSVFAELVADDVVMKRGIGTYIYPKTTHAKTRIFSN